MFGPVDEVHKLPVCQLDECVEQVDPGGGEAVVVVAVHYWEVCLLQGLQDAGTAGTLG